MAIENLKKHFILALLILNIAFLAIHCQQKKEASSNMM
jgi:regulatory protein YycI of two-component signal transduction system YycFG